MSAMAPWWGPPASRCNQIRDFPSGVKMGDLTALLSKGNGPVDKIK